MTLRTRHRLAILALLLCVALFIQVLTAPKVEASIYDKSGGYVGSHPIVGTAVPALNAPLGSPTINPFAQTYFDIQAKIAKEKADKRAKIEAAKRAEAEKQRLIRLQAQKPAYVPRLSSSGNTYTAGYCTWGVKNWRPDIPNGWHDAYNWWYAARSAGWPTGYTPRVNAVGVAVSGNHVVLIIGVSGSTVTLKEMNYSGLYSVRTRTAPASDFKYIY